MNANRQPHRLLALVLAMIMVLSMLPAGVRAAEATIAGSPETVEVGRNAAAHRENGFNMGWKFNLGDITTAYKRDFDDSGWENVNLPHDFSITQHFTASGEPESGFLPGGTGWYRKHFVLAEESQGKTFLLNFDGVYMHATVYVNGNLVGEHHYGYTSFAFDITKHLVCDGVTENVIAVKAVSTLPSSRWYSGSGIYRDVTLYALDPVHVDLNGVTVTTPNIATGDGTANVKTILVNDGTTDVTATVTTIICEKGSEAAAATASTTVSVAAGATAAASTAPVVPSPKLWSIESPNLYTLKTEVTVDGQVVDTDTTEFGYRWFTWSSTGFALNGVNVKLNGVCMHHDQGGLGAAAYYDAIYRQMSIMKDMGANAIRTAHNPADEDLIAICNELGLLVIEESFDGLIDQKNGNYNDFSGYFERTASSGLYGYTDGMTNAEYAARSMVKRDKNAPAIIAWSFGNEIQEGTTWITNGAYTQNVQRYDEICASYISWVNEEDGSRIVTSGCNNRGGDQPLIDVINTITTAGGVAGFNYANSTSTLSTLASNYGGRHGCIIASETSSHINSRGRYMSMSGATAIDGAYHLTSYDTSAVSWGITAHDSIYNTYQLDNVAGEFVWTGFDYIGEPTPWNGTGTGDGGRGAIPNSSYFGIVETTGFAKDSYYLYRSQWNKNQTTVHLVTAWDPDNQQVSGTTPVWLYSNAPKVELYLNNTLIATSTRHAHTSAAEHTYYTYTSVSNDSACAPANGSGSAGLYGAYNVTFTAGTLYAKAYDENGVEIPLNDSMGRHSVTTPGTVTQLKATVNRTEMAADGQSLAYVEIDVLDDKGSLDTTAANNLTFTLTGPGEIAAVDNGDQATVRKYQNSYVLTDRQNANINAYAGKALVIVRSTEESGTITLNIAAEGLTGQTVTIHTTADSTAVTDGLVSYTMVRDYSIKTGTQPVLETTATGNLGNGSTISGSIAWDAISSEVYNTAGDYTISGTLTLEGQEPIPVTAKLHVIPNIIDLRNVSTATIQNNLPTLPATVLGVLADGTLDGEFQVTWNAPAVSEYDVVDEIVTVTGTAVVFGEETMDVTCTVRVAEPINTESTNVAPAAELSQDIPTASQSDNLLSITDGNRSPGEATSNRWTNWNYRDKRDTATITLSWDTAQLLSDINLYYRYDNSGCAKPASVVFSYSLDGVTFTEVGSTEAAISDVTVSNGAAFAYALDEVINPVALSITFTQQSGQCVGVYEVETMTYAASITMNSSADLSGIAVDGTAIDGFSADTLTYEVNGGTVTADTTSNAGITILPAYEGVVRILTVSEDGSAAKTYEITVGETDTCAHENQEVRGQSDATCTDDGYTGDTYCLDCGKLLSSGTVLYATGHSWSDWTVVTAATCTTAGSQTRSCSACSEIETQSISATGHQHTELRNKTDATCTTTGYTGDTWCTDCNTQIATGSVIDVTDHSWDAGVISKEATETEDGVKTFTCTVCGATRNEAVKYQRTLKTPTVSLKLEQVTGGKVRIIGMVDDYEHLDDYYEITGHGLLYIQKARIGTRILTTNTSGRTRVKFAGYNDDGSFSYTFKPGSKSTVYAYRAYITYVNPETGATVTVYSDMIRSSYNGIPNLP